jgi:hypothetical protein
MFGNFFGDSGKRVRLLAAHRVTKGSRSISIAYLSSAILVASTTWQPLLAGSKENSPATVTVIDPKTKGQIVDAEKLLATAIHTQDIAILDRILSDNYFDAIEGSDAAISKKGAVVRCKAGALPSYLIERELQFSRAGEIIILEGLAHVKSGAESPDRWMQVRHRWLNKDGRWVVISQLRRPLDGEHE